MNNNTMRTKCVAPFAPDYRAAGVLLHVTSLPSPYGVGDLGPSATAWIDRLATAGQSWWQLLPLGPTGFGHSPYQALSSFAANPLVVSPKRLIEDGLLTEKECGDHSFPADYVDFDRVTPFKEAILSRAWENFKRRATPQLHADFDKFLNEKDELQRESALFMVLREKFGRAPFTDWPRDVARREPMVIAQARRELADSIRRFRFGQFCLLRQWKTVRDYAHRCGVQLLGDLPIFVAPDSADVWANPELFLLDEGLRPRVVAGVPPDYFSADGQLWGNPLYDWDALKRTDYRWWIERLRARLEIVDAIRIDHFRGFQAAWHIPAGATTAAAGRWEPGPGADFFKRVRNALGGLPLLAEDLGLITPPVTTLRDQFQLPGMRVLQFAFNGDPQNPHLPINCIHNGVVYTGTHDNNTTGGWYDTATQYERANFWKCADRTPGNSHDAIWELIRLAMSSVAAVAIVPLQDVLGLGSSARMNTPGRAEGQWRWRCTDAAFTDVGWERLRKLTNEARRAT